jgi:RNA polymerase sigma factor (sigma-70 family)
VTEFHDSELLAAYAHSREEAAFRQIVERYIDLVYSSALRQLRAQRASPALADDVTQAVFIILMRRASTLRDGRLLAAWLLQTTRHCVRDVLKSERRRQRREADMTPPLPGPDASAPVWVGDDVLVLNQR